MLLKRIITVAKFAAIISIALGTTAVADGPEQFLIKSAETLDKVFDFLITLDLALFGIVGFFVRNGLSKSPRIQIFQIGALVLFVTSASYSLFCGYKGRLQLAVILASRGSPFPSVQDWYAYQAASVVMSGILAAIIVILTWLGADRTTQEGMS